jgi:molybdopterin molybdotransferase
MTGAVLPVNSDVVIPYEMVSIEKGQALVSITSVTANQNIHKRGIDKKKNELLIAKNTLISTAELGVFATVGKDKVKVSKLPKIIIISTGNELVDVSEKPAAHQIRRSNVFTLQGLLAQKGIKAETAHLPDKREILIREIAAHLDQFDVLIFSGAVSKGKFDFLPQVLEELGVKKHFHRVAQRPGKPFWFGTKNEVSVFALPGNPISTFVCCLNYFFPWYWNSTEVADVVDQFAILTEDFEFSKPLTYFLQVKLSSIEGKTYATPEVGNGSGDLANLILADAFLELPQDRSTFTKGESFRVIPFRNF